MAFLVDARNFHSVDFAATHVLATNTKQSDSQQKPAASACGNERMYGILVWAGLLSSRLQMCRADVVGSEIPFGLKWCLKIVVHHLILSSFNMSSFQAIWIHFKNKQLIVFGRISNKLAPVISGQANVVAYCTSMSGKREHGS